MQHFEALPARFLWRRQWVRFRFGEPTGEIQWWRRRKRTRIWDKVLAYHLEGSKNTAHSKSDQIKKIGHPRATKTHPTIVPRHVRVCQYLREHGAQGRRTVGRVASAGDFKSLADGNEERGTLLGRGERKELGDLEGGDAERARVIRKDGAVVGQPLDLR
jgi:hypothetical protein